jgi:uncharacterized protein YkwD
MRRLCLLSALAFGMALAPVAQAGEVEQQALALINQARAKAGCGPLQQEGRLTAAAAAHAAAMAKGGFFSHTDPNGGTPMRRVKARGYNYRAMAENIAAGNAAPDKTVAQWVNSAGHRKNLLNCRYTQTGIVRAYDAQGKVLPGQSHPMRYYWVQVFGTP